MRRILIGIAGLVVLILIAIAAALAALNTGEARTRIAGALSSMLGAPVTVGTLSTSLVPSPGLEAGQIRIGAGGADAAPGVSVQSLRIVPDLFSLLPGRTLTIRRIDLNGLVISALRTAAGKWEVPVPPGAGGASPQASGRGGASAPKGSPAAGAPAVGVNIGLLRLRDGAVRVVDDSLRQADGKPTVTSITGISTGLTINNGTVSIPSFNAHIGQTSVVCTATMGPNGIDLHVSTPTIHEGDLAKFLALAGMAADTGLSIAGAAPIELTTHVASDLTTFTASGKVSVGTVHLYSITLEKLSAPFTFLHRVFALSPVAFSMYGGHQRGTVSVDLRGHQPGFKIKTTVDSLDVDQALSATTTLKHVLLGRAHAAADLAGSGTAKSDVERTVTGTVQFALRDGDLKGYPIIAVLNKALGLAEGSTSDTKFDSLTGSATVGGGQARTNDLVLAAKGLTVTGAGTVGFDQRLNLKLVATIAPGAAPQGSTLAALEQRLTGAKGNIQIPMTVTGTATSPHIVPDMSAVAKSQLPGLIKKIF
jgi:uncharacterized protein involved in outer membrane biogenesis